MRGMRSCSRSSGWSRVPIAPVGARSGIQTTANNGAIEVTTGSGTLTVSQALTAHGSGAVDLNSGTLNFEGVRAVGDLFRTGLDALGFERLDEPRPDEVVFLRAGAPPIRRPLEAEVEAQPSAGGHPVQHVIRLKTDIRTIQLLNTSFFGCRNIAPSLIRPLS